MRLSKLKYVVGLSVRAAQVGIALNMALILFGLIVAHYNGLSGVRIPVGPWGEEPYELMFMVIPALMLGAYELWRFATAPLRKPKLMLLP